MTHDGLQALLEHISDGTIGWGESSRARESACALSPAIALASSQQETGTGQRQVLVLAFRHPYWPALGVLTGYILSCSH